MKSLVYHAKNFSFKSSGRAPKYFKSDMLRVMIIHFTVKTVVDSKFIDDKTGGKNMKKAIAIIQLRNHVPNSSYNEDGEEIRS